MRIAVYSPYLDTFGGGEKYMMTIAQLLSSDNSVEVFLDRHLSSFGGNYLKSELSKRFNLDLTKVDFISAPVGENSSFFSRLIFLNKYDLLFYLTDGSIFFPTSKKNILHIQSPLVGQPAKSLWGKLKLKGWNLIIYNSLFTRQNSKAYWPLASQVIYPPVDTKKIKPLKKENYILSVGRFFGYLKDKKHKFLINVFRNLYEDGKLRGWSLHLVGSAGKGDLGYLKKLETIARGLPVKFYPNLEYDDLVKLYGQAGIYWHAAGYLENEPTKMEHFGIATVEAMAGGAVPVVIGKGGQNEIVENGESGYLWSTSQGLKKYTLDIINNEKIMTSVSKKAVSRASFFSSEKFKEDILKLTQ